MINYEVDIPVRITIWIREEFQKKQFEVIKKAKPSIIFLQSDGGRNELEDIIIRKNRIYIENNINWNCKVYKLYENNNLGLYDMSKKTNDFIWKRVDRCVFLEDDIVPSVSFFTFCKELLDIYENDLRIECICGFNHLEIHEEVSSDYFFCRQGSVWGYATWRRAWEGRYDFSYFNDRYVLKLLKNNTKRNKSIYKKLSNYPINDNYEGHAPAFEFFTELAMYTQNRLQIVPKKNMICNLGCDEHATNSPNYSKIPYPLRTLFNMKTYELESSLNHPKYVINDEYYEIKRNKILAYNNKLMEIYYFLYYFFHLTFKNKIKFFNERFSGLIRKVKQ